ncbi:MAG: type II toxin-antitoxin system HicA family toxin [Gammaproteobacteria bacterium]|nr:type II toxin-antitoxin system HicA family toxin [Gammaproteobacteria bacterium]
MRVPRTVSGESLAKSLQKLGYRTTRQTGSHIRLTCDSPNQHHITIPNHDPIRLGTLSAILADVASHLKMPKENLVRQLFG